ncbi:hypothetical protein N7G274_006832 [Stereocaulon virgatum]|uniref:Uncharacterized protein n=1 Tax=Stereocaulon virgatum TaxID=373712 RepID=A0ABR4A4F9_9LECA
MASVHAVMPGSFAFDTTLPPKLDINVGAKSHIFQPPNTFSASSSLYRSTTSLSSQNASGTPSRKRSRHDSHMSDQATPVSIQSHAWSTVAADTPSSETPGAMSPVPFVNTQYELAGGLDTPTAARSSAMDEAEATPDVHLRGGRGFRGFDIASEGYFSYTPTYSPPALAREANGRARQRASPRVRDGLGRAVYSFVGVAGKVLEFCKTTAFRGFYAGGGQGYEMRPSLRQADADQSIWLDTHDDEDMGAFEQRQSTIPGRFPEEDYIPEYMSQDHNTPPRASKRIQREKGTAEIGASWVMVGSNPNLREGSPSRLSHRKIPSANTAAPRARPKLGRRPILPASRPSLTSYAGSPGLRSDRPASFASPRSPSVMTPKHESPVSVEVQRHAARMRKRELEEDANLKRFNQQLRAMIREGKEALGTRFEVEDEDEEPLDEGYAEGSYFDEKWKG